MKGVSELEARLDGLLEGELDWARFELDWARLGDTELVRDLRCYSLGSADKISFHLGGEPIEFLEARRPLARLLQQKRFDTRSSFKFQVNVSNCLPVGQCRVIVSWLGKQRGKATCMLAASTYPGNLTDCGTCNQTFAFSLFTHFHFLLIFTFYNYSFPHFL